MNPARHPVLHSAWSIFLPELAAETLPRYTSYPPANRFSEAVTPQIAMAALRQLPANAKLSLYVHIPFCRQLCWYCGCHTSVPTRSDRVDAYLTALHAEIDIVARTAPPGARVTHLHFGGGSPDTLTAVQIDELMGHLHANFQFAPDAEIAAELDPRGTTVEVVEALAEGGLSRASFGVQVLNIGVQARINRVQPRELVVAAAGRLRAAGVAALNVDIMYGLPGQSVDHVVETAEFAAELGSSRTAVFGYAHVPWFKKHQKAIDTDQLPGSEDRFRQAEAAAASMELNGYTAIGFDHFAAPGDEMAIAAHQGRIRRNFQGYTTDAADALIGLGASSISSLPGLYYQNTPDTSAYRAFLANGQSPVSRGAKISPDDIERGSLIESILCNLEARVPSRLLDAAAPRLGRLHDAGLIDLHDGHMAVTRRGRPYLRNIAASFDPDIIAAGRRHSLAI